MTRRPRSVRTILKNFPSRRHPARHRGRRRPRRAARTSRSTAPASGPGARGRTTGAAACACPREASAGCWSAAWCSPGSGSCHPRKQQLELVRGVQRGHQPQGAAPAASAAAAGRSERSAAGAGPRNANDEPPRVRARATGFVGPPDRTRIRDPRSPARCRASSSPSAGTQVRDATDPQLRPRQAPTASPRERVRRQLRRHPGHTPSPRLDGCVQQVTGGVTPSLVDRASYDGSPPTSSRSRLSVGGGTRLHGDRHGTSSRGPARPASRESPRPSIG